MEIRSGIIHVFLSLSLCLLDLTTTSRGKILVRATIEGNVDGKNSSAVGKHYAGTKEKPALAPDHNFILMKASDEGESLEVDHLAAGRSSVYTRKDRFYYCGPKNKRNYCRSLCYAMGYPTYVCGSISCYCTF